MEAGKTARVVIVGGGIAGLAAAHRLIERASGGGSRLEITVLDSASRPGGVIETRTEMGCLLETGPDAFITQKPAALELVKRLGLEGELVNTNSEKRVTMIVSRGRIHPLPEGFMMLAPSRVRPFLVSPIISPAGKLRMALEFFLPPAQEVDDESLADFVRRRLGSEALARIAQPMVSGIYTADPERLSLRATMPRFLDMEREGGILRTLLRTRRNADASAGARYSMFVTPRGGLGQLIDRLVGELPDRTVRTGTTISRLDRGQQKEGRFRLQAANQQSFEADAVILAVPAHQAAGLVSDLDLNLSSLLGSIRFASSAVLNLIYSKESIKSGLDGFGFVVPAVENLSMLACTFSSIKFPHRAPAELIALRVFLGGELQGELLDLTDSEIERRVALDLHRLLDISARPLFGQTTRHMNAMPQYDVGHLDLVGKIMHRLENQPGLEVAGNSYYGIGIPDCVASGESAADRIYSYLSG